MKLRVHPLLRHNLIHQWPPIWVSLDKKDKRRLIREEGVLTEVREPLSRSNGIVLIMDYNNYRYGSILVFSDLAFRGQIFELLKNSVGLSIQQIGDIDLSYTL